jgi:chromosome partitioning protein
LTRTIATINFKGGSGKTTTVVNLGMALALRGARVLLVDLDPQGNVAEWLGVARLVTVSDILTGRAEWSSGVVSARDRLDIIPSDRRLGEVERALTAQKAPAEAIASRLAGIERAGYDYVIFDCAPSISLLSECALLLAREVIVPISMEYLALLGARDAIIEILRARRLSGDRSARLALVVPTFYSERQLKSQDMLRVLRERFPGMVSPPIRVSVRISESSSHQLSIFEYDPHGPGSEDFAQLADDVVARGRAHG